MVTRAVRTATSRNGSRSKCVARIPVPAGQAMPIWSRKSSAYCAPALGDHARAEHQLQQEVPSDDPGDHLPEGGVGERVGRAGHRHRRGELRVAEGGERAADRGDDERDDDRGAGVCLRGPAGQGEDAGTDDDADAEDGEVHGAEALLELVLRLARLRDRVLDRLGPKDAHGFAFWISRLGCAVRHPAPLERLPGPVATRLAGRSGPGRSRKSATGTSAWASVLGRRPLDRDRPGVGVAAAAAAQVGALVERAAAGRVLAGLGRAHADAGGPAAGSPGDSGWCGGPGGPEGWSGRSGGGVGWPSFPVPSPPSPPSPPTPPVRTRSWSSTPKISAQIAR